MNWYLASRMRHRETIKKINSLLKSKNQNISYEWAELKTLKPYPENKTECSKVAKEISESISNTDIFILISDKEGTDMFIELGIILEKWRDNKLKKVYILGKHKDRSLMHFHPAIKKEETLKEILAKEIPNKLNKNDLKMLQNLDREINNNS